MNDDQRFSDLQYAGAKEYGGNWLTANRVAISLLREADLDLKKYRVLGTMIALRICQHAKP